MLLIDSKRLIEILKFFKKTKSSSSDEITTSVRKDGIFMSQMTNYFLIEYRINCSIETPHLGTYQVNLSDWISALTDCISAFIRTTDFSLHAIHQWGEIEVIHAINTRNTEINESTIPIPQYLFKIPSDALVNSFNRINSKLITLNCFPKMFKLSDENRTFCVKIDSNCHKEIQETTFDRDMIKDCLIFDQTLVGIYFEHNEPLHLEFDLFFQNKLRFVFAPVVSEEEFEKVQGIQEFDEN